MKFTKANSNRFLSLAEREHQVHGQDPNSFMVAPVDDRTSNVKMNDVSSSAKRTSPRPFTPMHRRNKPFQLYYADEEFVHVPHPNDDHHRRLQEARMNAHVEHLERHPGMYANHSHRASKQDHPMTTKTYPRKPKQPRRLNYNTSAEPFVPSVAAHTHHHDPVPRASPRTNAGRATTNNQTQGPPKQQRRLFPFNTKTRTPAQRSPTFKRDVMEHFSSHDRREYHERLDANYQAVNQHFHQQANRNTRNVITPNKTRHQPLARNNQDSTYRGNCAPNTTPQTYRRTYIPADQQSWFEIKQFTINKNNCHKI